MWIDHRSITSASRAATRTGWRTLGDALVEVLGDHRRDNRVEAGCEGVELVEAVEVLGPRRGVLPSFCA